MGWTPVRRYDTHAGDTPSALAMRAPVTRRRPIQARISSATRSESGTPVATGAIVMP